MRRGAGDLETTQGHGSGLARTAVRSGTPAHREPIEDPQAQNAQNTQNARATLTPDGRGDQLPCHQREKARPRPASAMAIRSGFSGSLRTTTGPIRLPSRQPTPRAAAAVQSTGARKA